MTSIADMHLNRWSHYPAFRCSSSKQSWRKHERFFFILVLIFLIPLHPIFNAQLTYLKFSSISKSSSAALKWDSYIYMILIERSWRDLFFSFFASYSFAFPPSLRSKTQTHTSVHCRAFCEASFLSR